MLYYDTVTARCLFCGELTNVAVTLVVYHSYNLQQGTALLSRNTVHSFQHLCHNGSFGHVTYYSIYKHVKPKYGKFPPRKYVEDPSYYISTVYIDPETGIHYDIEGDGTKIKTDDFTHKIEVLV